MPLPLLAAAPLISAGVNALTSVGNMASQHFANKQSQKYNTWMYKMQEQDRLKNWNLQNAYNTPAAQMQRLKEAGLNPNLVYGGGNAATTAQPIQGANAGSWKPEAPRFEGNPMASYYDTKLQQIQLDNLTKQGQLLEQDKINKETQNLVGLQNIARSKYDMQRLQQLTPYQISAMETSIKKGTESINQMVMTGERQNKLAGASLAETAANIALKKAQTNNLNISAGEIRERINNLKKDGVIKNFEIELNKKGFTKSDPYYFRVGMKLADQILGNLPNAAKSFNDWRNEGASKFKGMPKVINPWFKWK